MLALAGARPALATGTRIVCVDGPSGSGKSTLAADLAAAVPPGDAVVVQLDDLLDGWDGGLTRMISSLVGHVLAPLSAGRASGYRRYDWHAGRFAEWTPVPPVPLVVVEGVGAGARLTAPYRSLCVWVEAPRELRLARGIARDGEAFAPHWLTWADQEDIHFARDETRRRADLTLTTG
ncbi:4-amino-4-deoxy-L-arabinose transferase [Nocardioides campestrisoli]|uniref:4-amino-4-deoxy-L-arabinose transferase n=1 Tax=Nocardioides campestrisoli TaxID=2736757 RepID=UPI0015E73C88|nr:4-amino-4-deoxy-L-arabinose transferase [Nocardioides campestrisoli]